MRHLRQLSVVLAVFAVTACADPMGSDIYSYTSRDMVNKLGTLNVISAAVTMGTDKTLTDHFASMKSGKDCSTVRLEQGRTYCREDEPNPMPEMHCYRSLADVTCYQVANPARLESGRVGSY